MMSTKRQHMALVILLVSVSVVALQAPLSSLVRAQQLGFVTINASGIAFRIEDGTSASATLTLTGTSQDEKLGDLSGTLLIGSLTYNISNGQGEANRRGIINILADAGDNRNLTLYGTNRNGDLVFNFPESKLSPQYSLYLVGQLSSSNSSSSPSSESSIPNQSSSEASSSSTQNENENATIIQIVTSAQPTTQSATSAPPITQAGSSETVVTVTANVTVTVTTTSTVANTTITVQS